MEVKLIQIQMEPSWQMLPLFNIHGDLNLPCQQLIIAKLFS